MDNCNFFPPLQLLIYRLQSLGDATAYNLSKTVQIISDIKNSLKTMKRTNSIKEIQDRPTYQMFLKKNETLLNEFSEKYPIIFWRGSNFENPSVHRICQMGFNHQIIKIMGESIENFVIKLMKTGIPNFLIVEENYFQILNKILINVFLPQLSDGNLDLSYYIKSSNTKLRSRMITLTNKFDEDDFSEVFLLEAFEINKFDLSFVDLIKQRQLKIMPEKTFWNRKEGMNVILEEDACKDGNTKWINNFYPNFNIKLVENYEDKKKLRCKFRTIENINK